MPAASAAVTDEEFAVRDMVRSWAASSDSISAARAVEQGDPDAWRAPYRGLAQLGMFGVAIPEELGGAGGSVEDLCLMIDEAAAALVPGPVATTALATLVVTDETLLEALASGERTAGVALRSDIRYESGTATGTAEFVLGGLADGVLILPAGEKWILVDATADGVTVEALTATDFSRPLARVTLTSAPAATLDLPYQRFRRPGRHGAGRRGRRAGAVDARDGDRVREGARAVRQADRQLPGGQAHVCRDAAAVRADPCRRGRRGGRGHRQGRTAAVDRRCGRRGHRHRRGQAQRPRLHPGARRHRHHLGARCTSLHAPCLRPCAVPRRQVALAAPQCGADQGRRAQATARRRRWRRGHSPRDRGHRRRHRGPGRRQVAGGPGRDGAAGAALAEAVRARAPPRPSSW